MEEKTEIENVVNLDENIDNIESNNNNDNNDKSKDENKKKNKKSFKEFFKKYSIMNYIAIGIALYFFTVLLVGQFKTVSYSEEIVQGKRETQLSEELINLKSKYDELEQNYKKAQTIVEEYQNNASTNNELITSMKEKINNYSLLAGVTDVKGEGIVITLTDGAQTVDSSNENVLVHDSDLLTVVNELRAAGAEAISINDQRIISTSSIRCVGPVIQVNYQKVSTPFVIKAIGKSEYLESAMNIKKGVVDLLKGYGVGVTVERKSNITIPKYDGNLNYTIAQSVNE